MSPSAVVSTYHMIFYHFMYFRSICDFLWQPIWPYDDWLE